MTDHDDHPAAGAGVDPHADYRQQAAAHFGSDVSPSAGARTPRLFRPAGDPAQSTPAPDDTAPPGSAAAQSGLPPQSGQRFGAGTTYTGRGPQQTPPPSPPPPPYVAPPSPPSAAPTAGPTPPSQPSWQGPQQYSTPVPPVNYPNTASSLSALWQRFNDSVDRLLARGANGELLRQPWFDSLRHQNADLFVYLSYGAAAVISLVLGAGTASAAVMILLGGLWAGLAYLYIALNTRLARQFLEFGICLVAVVVSAGMALSALATLFGDGFAHGYPTAIAEGFFGLLFSVATGLFFGAVGLRVHQAVPLPPPPAQQAPFASQASPPPGPPGQANWPGGQPASPWPPQVGGPQFAYPATGGTAVAAAVLSFVGVVWFGIAAKDAAQVLHGLIQMMSSFSQLGIKLGWPFYAAIALSAVQILIPILLLIGGIQLLSRRLAGRKTIAWGCALLLGLTAFWLLVFVDAAEWLNTWSAGFGSHLGLSFTSIFAEAGLRFVVAPAVFAIITMVCALSPSTRLWCRPPGSAYGTPW